MAYTTPEQLDNAYTTLHKTFKTGKTKSLAWRKWQLKQLFWMVADNEEAFAKALNTDLNRHEFEAHYGDIIGVKTDILDTLRHVEEWAADDIPDAGFLFGTLGSARIRKEPLGVALIIGIWNFPILLTLCPLIAAISAGCCAMVKPAETSVACQDLMAALIPKYLDQEAVRVVTGGPKEATMILERRFDHIFYTGSVKIAKIVAAAAAKHLTPTVLELGGQAPCIVTPSADIDTAAKRIVFSKYFNNGQICLAANHVFVDPSVHDKFVERAIYWLGQYLQDGGADDAVRIINEQNYDRIVGLLKKTDGKIVFGGKTAREDKYIQQTLVTNVTMQDPLLSEEIFGPLLPIMALPYREACTITQRGDHPLAVYIFSTSQHEIEYIIKNTLSGGVTINDFLLHAAVPNAPFGGVGNSGMGAYHGKYGFDAFTHRRSIVTIPSYFDYLLSFRYPPYKTSNISKLKTPNPPFKRRERMSDQKVGRQMSDMLKTWVGWGVKCGGLVIALGVLDEYCLGGRSGVLGLVRGLWGRGRRVGE